MNTKKSRKKQPKFSIILIIIVAFVLIMFLLLQISNSALVFDDLGNVYSDISTKREKAKEKDESTGYDIVDTTEKPETASYSEIEKDSEKQYTFMIKNETDLQTTGFLPEQIATCKKIVNEYMEQHPNDVFSSNISAEEPTIYNQDNYFGVVFCLNEEDGIYLKITCDGENIRSQEIAYTKPTTQNKQDIEDEKQEHEDYSILYKKTYPMDTEEFPFSSSEVNTFVEKYFSDLTTQNLYEDYVVYYLPMSEYMQREWEAFSNDFSTFKNDVEQLKAKIANGDSDLEKNGRLSAKVTAYRRFSRTLLVAKVAVTLTSANSQNSSAEYVTLGYDDNLFILPHDMFSVEYWRYLYLY